MASLSPYSRMFTDVKNELQGLVDSGQIKTNEQKKEFVRSKGLDVQDYIDTYKEYKTIASTGKKAKEELEKPGYLIPRVALGAVGKFAEGVQRAFPETIEKITHDLSESLERKKQKYFFPTQGEGEQAVSEVGALVAGAIPAVRAISLGAKGLKLAQGAKG